MANSTPAAADMTQPSTVDFQKMIRDKAVTEAAIEREVRDKLRARTVNVHKLSVQLGRRYGPTQATIDAYVVYHEKQKAVVGALREYVANLADNLKRGRGIVLIGTVGTGKDHLMAAVLYAVAGIDYSCRWINGQELYGAMRDRIDGPQSEDSFIRGLATPAVLAISDPVPPAGRPSEWNLAQLYRLVDRRDREQRATFCTVNAKDREDADAKLSPPVWDRLCGNAVVLEAFWPSYRTRGS